MQVAAQLRILELYIVVLCPNLETEEKTTRVVLVIEIRLSHYLVSLWAGHLHSCHFTKLRHNAAKRQFLRFKFLLLPANSA